MNMNKKSNKPFGQWDGGSWQGASSVTSNNPFGQWVSSSHLKGSVPSNNPLGQWGTSSNLKANAPSNGNKNSTGPWGSSSQATTWGKTTPQSATQGPFSLQPASFSLQPTSSSNATGGGEFSFSEPKGASINTKTTTNPFQSSLNTSASVLGNQTSFGFKNVNPSTSEIGTQTKHSDTLAFRNQNNTKLEQPNFSFGLQQTNSNTAAVVPKLLTKNLPTGALELIGKPFPEFVAKPLSALVQTSAWIEGHQPDKQEGTIPRAEIVAAETQLTDSYHSFRLADSHCIHIVGAPSAIALYNMACVLSLALELQMVVCKAKSLKELVHTHGSSDLDTLTTQHLLVCPRLPPLNSHADSLSGRTLLRDVMEKRMFACDRCLKAAVATGWTDIQHLLSDRDLLVYRQTMDLSWLPSPHLA